MVVVVNSRQRMAMAAAEISDITDQYRTLARQMNDRIASSEPLTHKIARTIEIPGSDDLAIPDGMSIGMTAWNRGGLGIPGLDGEIWGNRESLDQLISQDPRGVYRVAWHNYPAYRGQQYDEDERNHILRTVRREVPRFVKDLPDRVLIENAPDGASQGDFGRARMYQRMGVGPVDQNFQQYGFLKDREVKPVILNPPAMSFLQDLQSRIQRSGSDPALDATISEEIRRRKEFAKMYNEGYRYPSGDHVIEQQSPLTGLSYPSIQGEYKTQDELDMHTLLSGYTPGYRPLGKQQ